MVDWARCDGCAKCVAVCERGALAAADSARATPRARSASSKPTPSARRPRSGTVAAKPRAASARAGGRLAAGEWSVLEAVAAISVTFAAFMAKEVVLLSDAVRGLPADVQAPVRVGVLALYYIIQLVLLSWLVSRRDEGFAEALRLRRPRGGFFQAMRSVWLVVAGLLATRAVATVYGLVTRELGLTPQAGTETVTRVFGTQIGGLLLAFVMLVIVGPFVEELIFRGVCMRGLESRIGAWPAIAVQALVFAAFHRSWWLLFPMTGLGVALGWLAHERDSLWPAVALHAAYNAVSLLAVAWVLVSA